MDIAVVTGAGGGLGRHLAVGLAEAGAQVIAADLDSDAADETARMVNGLAVRCDVTDPADAERLIGVAVDAGGPHLLINNAGGWTPGSQFPAAAAPAWAHTRSISTCARPCT